MKNRLIVAFVVILLGAFTIISFTVNKSKDANQLYITVDRSDFEITVKNSGELEAMNSIPIMGPEGLAAARVWSVKIEDIVVEGTMVEKGDYVATLDRTEIGEKIRNEELDLEESINNFERTKIDTALDLRQRRDELKKKELQVVRRKLDLHNSTYEPPAIIQQAELTLKEAEMDYELALSDYHLRKEKATTSIKRRRLDLVDDQQDLKLLTGLYEKFVVYAPERGMVIYHRDKGKKIAKGSTINARNPIVATLPDLERMISRCYVNEVDIRLIEVGQEVRVGIDAFPSKRLTGKIKNIANVGESSPTGDAKVFEVVVEIDQMDPDLKPGMTSSNEIIVHRQPDLVNIPLECLHLFQDSINYVYLQHQGNLKKKRVVPGKSNSNMIVIQDGLNVGDRVLLSIPDDHQELAFYPN